jgi:hypothetical protein
VLPLIVEFDYAKSTMATVIQEEAREVLEDLKLLDKTANT